jgi:hypothetical protein
MMKRGLILFILFGIAWAWHVTPLRAQNSIAVSVPISYGHLKYGKHDIRSKGGFHPTLGLTFRHQFSENWQFAIGVNYRKYSGFMDYNGMKDSVHLYTIDPETGIHNYFLCQVFHSIEKQTVTFLEPNIRLEYIKPLSSRVDLIAGIGLVFGIHLAETNEMTSGSYDRYTWFYDNHNWPDEIESMNLGTYEEFLYPWPGNIFKNSFFALGEIGFSFKFSSRWRLLMMLNAQHSLLNVQVKHRDTFTHHWSYSGIAASEIPKGVRAISAGLEIGLVFEFRNPNNRRFGTSQRGNFGKSTNNRSRSHIRAVHCPSF